jgi:putative FmdB family regulatory protein
MPLYEYSCPVCQDRFEKLRSMSDGEAAVCPACGTVSRRVLSLMAAPVRVAVGVGAGPSASPSAGACCGGACGCG